MTPLLALPPEPVRPAAEVNEVLHVEASAPAAVTVTPTGDGVSFRASDDVFPDEQRIFEPGIRYREWAPEQAPDAEFASKLDFLEFLD